MRRLFLFALAAATVPWASAQVRMAAGVPVHSAGFASAPAHAAGSASAVTVRFVPSEHRRGLSPFFDSGLLLGDLLWDGYPGYAAPAGQPPVIVVQAPPAAADTREQSVEQAPAPVLIEWHEDHYVRLTRADERVPQDQSAPPTKQSAKTSAHAASAAISVPARAVATTPPCELAPVLLVFRDGHSEAVHEYAIADGVIYARGDYWADGYWNKKIELSALNLPETVKSNEERGVRFLLPAGPNEVVTRP